MEKAKHCVKCQKTESPQWFPKIFDGTVCKICYEELQRDLKALGWKRVGDVKSAMATSPCPLPDKVIEQAFEKDKGTFNTFLMHILQTDPEFSISELLRLIPFDSTIVDQGSGNGYWSAFLSKLGFKVIAVDPVNRIDPGWGLPYGRHSTYFRLPDHSYLSENVISGEGSKVLFLMWPAIDASEEKPEYEEFKQQHEQFFTKKNPDIVSDDDYDIDAINCRGVDWDRIFVLYDTRQAAGSDGLHQFLNDPAALGYEIILDIRYETKIFGTKKFLRFVVLQPVAPAPKVPSGSRVPAPASV